MNPQLELVSRNDDDVCSTHEKKNHHFFSFSIILWADFLRGRMVDF